MLFVSYPDEDRDELRIAEHNEACAKQAGDTAAVARLKDVIARLKSRLVLR